mmetsp:Transcript_51951/g.62471  ORF Transcript_51951/g.62471 Transcript_51951/m.62471 type:complete len:506 (-) Transcript_51951:257-1774(-)|eukprot:CAMPEP_0172507096 /NCGR_PEP_ID=MMETSP1066-20121228/201210_1 /TAXON_ID=671091 /ORGANISM="Coscinodiscus wailesii, Strain CCMP2513" /LENGTH=505 /DNA_ID=CAMNT_0013284485 /DNA_START=170 /DNA_END=1687 /DNA_ORIENTATION=-
MYQQQSQQTLSANAPMNTSNPNNISAVPTLKVMRLQSPDFDQPSSGALGSKFMLGQSLCLPDSFGVIHIGETFTAYLGALNISPDLPIRRLTVSATLQTPSRRFALPSNLDTSNTAGGIDIPPHSAIDAVVSRPLEEVGQHILRVEVGYRSNGDKTLRKFYRFHVASPLHIRELTLRGGDACCFVSIAIENATAGCSLTVTSADFQPPFGLVATKIGGPKCSGDFAAGATAAGAGGGEITTKSSATALWDDCGILAPGASFRYLFVVRAESQDAALRGVAKGDELGKAVFSWRKSFGEMGRIASTSVSCPPCWPGGVEEGLVSNTGGGQQQQAQPLPTFLRSGSKFVVHGSGLSVDAAASAANRSAVRNGANSGDEENGVGLDELLPVTVEPIDPPSRMMLGVPQPVQLLIVNHSATKLNLQLQMRLPHMSGVVVCGTSFKNLGEVGPNGGSCVVGVTLVALVAGFFRMQGCWVVDLTGGREIMQPALFNVFVEKASHVTAQEAQ